jgi:predicted adenylyl cyclase CyaB
MATNIEIKAKVKNLDALREQVEALSDVPGQSIWQEDTFFQVPEGRLKLRVLGPDRGELIYYQRPDAAGPKASNYLVYRTQGPAALNAVLSASLVVRGVLRKKRWLYHIGNTRVHLDQVQGLGKFLELEVALAPDQDPAQGETTALELMEQFGIKEEDLVEVAYIDLLLSGSPS